MVYLPLKVLVLSGEEECTDAETKSFFCALTNIVEEEVSSTTFLILPYSNILELLVLGTVSGDGQPGAPVQLCPQSCTLRPPPKAGLQGTQSEGVGCKGGKKNKFILLFTLGFDRLG